MSETNSGDRSAQVAHVLHGVRQAEVGEPGCAICSLYICPVCAEDVYCKPCYAAQLEYNERQYNYEDAKREWEERERMRSEYADEDEKAWWKTYKF